MLAFLQKYMFNNLLQCLSYQSFFKQTLVIDIILPTIYSGILDKKFYK